jgi:hypothetical protein
MNKYFIFIFLIVLTAAIDISAQGIIPVNRQGNWTTAGYSSNQRYIPRDFKKKTVTKASTLQGLINTQQSNARVMYYFPAGIYIFDSPIKIYEKAGIVISGAGSDQTVFKFDCPCVNPIGYLDSDKNPAFPPCSFGDLIDIKSSKNVGVENLKIIKTGYPSDYANNILLSSCTSCWVVGVESVKPMMFHIEISGGSHNIVRGCYLQDAEFTGQHNIDPNKPHTHGYGINVSGGATQCLVEDNICRYLRHGIAFDWSANENVAGYNYVCEGHAFTYFAVYGTYYHDWDILFHGSGNNRNLFEGNVVDLMGADNNVSAGGPYNTFYRNIAYCSQSIYDETNELTEQNMNIVGNIFTKDNELVCPTSKGSGNIDIYGLLNNIAGNHCDHANYVNAECSAWNGGSNNCDLLYMLPDFSYYYTTSQLAPAKTYAGESPDFWPSTDLAWPPIGPTACRDCIIEKNPAKLRWEHKGKVTVDAPPLELPVITLSADQYVKSHGFRCTFKVNGTNIGSSWSKPWPYGQPLTIEAVPPSGSIFYRWSDGELKNARTLKPKNNINLTAYVN